MEHPLESIRYGQKEEAEKVVGRGILGLKTQILKEVDKEIAVLETRLTVKLNEDC